MSGQDPLNKEIQSLRQARLQHGAETCWNQAALRLRNYSLDPMEWPENAREIWFEHIALREPGQQGA